MCMGNVGQQPRVRVSRTGGDPGYGTALHDEVLQMTANTTNRAAELRWVPGRLDTARRQ